jgi:hypothetical protein
MQSICRKLGFAFHPDADQEMIKAVFNLKL